MRTLAMLLVSLALLSGCKLTLPSSGVVGAGSTEVSPLCIEANDRYQGWHATAIVFEALGTATSGAVVTSEFLTDEEWVPAAFSIGGLVFGGIGIAGGLLADDAAEDVLRFCGTSE